MVVVQSEKWPLHDVKRVLTAWKRLVRQINGFGRCVMDKKLYERPKVFELGTVKEFTETTPEADKCSGSPGDLHSAFPLSPHYSGDCP